jgi:sugar transferase (PEP-CTERM/EpsH1 system associated)
VRLLIATYRLPLGGFTADRNTVFNTIKYFARRHSVALVSFTESPEEERNAGKLRSVCASVDTVPRYSWRSFCGAALNLLGSEPLQVGYYRNAAMRRLIEKVIQRERIDLAYAYHLRMGQYFAHLDSVPRCIALQPAQTLHLQRLKRVARNPLMRLVYEIEYHKMRQYEPHLAARFDCWVVISEKDRASVDPTGQLGNFLINPHGVDPAAFSPDPSVPKEAGNIIFASSIRGEANVDAVLFFCRDIYPRIKAQFGGSTKLYIVGVGPPPRVRSLARWDPTITVTGYVPDFVPYLRRAIVGIDPLRSGAGLQNKILEGMAVGLPMVVTTVANEGIGAEPGREIIVADEPEAFAREVCILLTDSARREAISREARAFIERSFSWEQHFEPLEEHFKSLLATRSTVAANEHA